VTPIDEKMRKSRLKLIGHVQRKVINCLVRKSDLIQVKGTKKGRGRPKITLVEIVKNDMSSLRVRCTKPVGLIEVCASRPEHPRI
jgi:hypothetical protein